MAESKIEWTEKVWNPLTGCTRIGQGCVHCYAERMAKRLQAMGRPEYQGTVDAKGHWTGNIQLLFDRLHEPMTWKKPRRVFVNSMSDLFHEKVNALFVDQVVQVMKDAHWHTFQVLTKRYNRPPYVLKADDVSKNIWIGYSICNQADADNAREHLRAVSEMGWHTWISYEPALELVDWTGYEFVEWMVCGGESGPGARPMHPLWARSALDWSASNGIPFFFKQWGEWMPIADVYADDPSEEIMEWFDKTICALQLNGYSPVVLLGKGAGRWHEGRHEFQPAPGSWWMGKVGKKAAGRLLDGQLHDEYPFEVK